MTATTFNTLTATRALEAAGLERQHAEAIADQLHVAASTDRDELATKGDLAGLEARVDARLAGLETRMYRALWILAVALLASQVAIAGFIVSMLGQGGQ